MTDVLIYAPRVEASEVCLKVEMHGRGGFVRRRMRMTGPRLTGVRQAIEKWGDAVMQVTYTDNEGDEVLVESEEEWDECLRLWSGSKCLRLQAVLGDRVEDSAQVDSSNPTPEPSPAASISECSENAPLCTNRDVFNENIPDNLSFLSSQDRDSTDSFFLVDPMTFSSTLQVVPDVASAEDDFTSHLEILSDLGHPTSELTLELLKRHNGNLDRVLAEL
eukprot:TRINITY_DN236_c1_g2_i1.p1 TRINITY_DN236_c1_g2~~TRINITY_DN236_c1_g2_i1.p1  ORF type:complete len:219 (+),score=26.07 TRINITY_DN236_c1_g2_i1:82-738(+)